MKMRHLVLSTALAGLLAGGAAYSPAAWAQAMTPSADSRQFENPAGPAGMPSPTDERAVLPGRGDTVAQSDVRGDSQSDVLIERRERPAEMEERPANMEAAPRVGPVVGETSATSTGPAEGAMAGVDAKELLGANLKNADNKKVGEVQAVQLDAAGKVRHLIVGVGGFMGLGERAVAVEPSALAIADGGDSLSTTLTEDQLKAMPEYEYSDKSYRGEVFNDSGIVVK